MTITIDNSTRRAEREKLKRQIAAARRSDNESLAAKHVNELLLLASPDLRLAAMLAQASVKWAELRLTTAIETQPQAPNDPFWPIEIAHAKAEVERLHEIEAAAVSAMLEE